MAILQLPVPETTAKRFQAPSAQQQTLVSQLVTDCLTEQASLTELMDYISFRATQRGLTPDLIQRLLANTGLS